MIAATTAPFLDLALIDSVDGAIGLAVSGGGDSVALAVLLAEARPYRTFTVLTVDHGLRPEAAEECRFVADIAARLGFPCLALEANGPPVGSLQTWAREARYTAIAEAANAHGLAAIATGHTLDDQAETLLLRLARGSGLRGLAAMRPDAAHHGIRILRPLLAARREELRDALRQRGIPWRDDPSNENTAYDRIAMRELAPALAGVGLTAERLAATAAHLARASDLVDGLVADLLSAAMRRTPVGAVVLSVAPWAGVHEEVRLRALAEAVRIAGGLDFPPRFETLAAAATALLRGQATTLGRCRAVSRGGSIVLWRERRGIEAVTVAPGESAVFDGRYRVTVPAGMRPVRVAAAGSTGREWAARLWRHSPQRAVLMEAAMTTPAIHLCDQVVALPTMAVRRRDWPANGANVRPER
ncbi:tRNA lysidine(34) synthetase TilS [Acuticoccus sediminis]|uniref:tRNA lysidine(34) synthetase TilS n=1 Tax=Acuticoccus sediminis TaxID=2184697 RepID=UPI001391066C|nr:tRNA lysidine(34) synthetase TilS [Acuticoccus sediminis]